MTKRSLARSLRSPVASTVFAMVMGFGGLALAGSRTYDAPQAGDGPTASDEVQGAATDSTRGAHGAEVSAFATRTDLIGWRKGAAIADLASDGRSLAGDHGPHAGEEPGDAASNAPGAAAASHAAADHAAGGAGS